MRPTLYIFMGYPGAGKTTVARILHDLTGAEHIWGDHERLERYGDRADHSTGESLQLYEALNQRAADLLAQGISVIYDTNFNYHSDRQAMQALAHRYEADFKVIWMTTDKSLAHKRATEESAGKAIRIWGNMSDSDFDRLSGKLEPSRPDEPVIEIVGEGVTPETVRQAILN